MFLLPIFCSVLPPSRLGKVLSYSPVQLWCSVLPPPRLGKALSYSPVQLWCSVLPPLGLVKSCFVLLFSCVQFFLPLGLVKPCLIPPVQLWCSVLPLSRLGKVLSYSPVQLWCSVLPPPRLGKALSYSPVQLWCFSFSFLLAQIFTVVFHGMQAYLAAVTLATVVGRANCCFSGLTVKLVASNEAPCSYTS